MRHSLTLLCALLASALASPAHDFSAVSPDGVIIYYSITSAADRTCEVTASLVADNYCGSMAIPARVTHGGVAYRVTAIGRSAFSECYDLTSVAIPEGVESVGDYAFDSCTFMESVELPASLTSIGDDAFGSCMSLTSVEIPDGVSRMGENPFLGCDRLESFSGPLAAGGGRCLILDDVLVSFAPAGPERFDIPAKVTAIGAGAFSDCNGLTAVTIPATVTSIGRQAFLCCTGLREVALPASLIEIGDEAFSGCGLTSLELPPAVTSIGSLAFNYCRFTSLVLPPSVVTIGDEAFDSCPDLATVVIPESVTSLGAAVFRSNPSLRSFSGKYASADGRCLIVDSVLNSFAPAGLTAYAIPASVTAIGDGAFWRCDELKSLTLPGSLATIGKEGIGCCSALTAITIPATVTAIGEPGLAGCTDLRTVTVLGTTPPAAPYNAFANDPTATCTLIVPTEAAARAYRSAPYWKDFKIKVKGE